MGYYIDSMTSETFTIDGAVFMKLLREWEELNPDKHMSWCQRVTDVPQTSVEVIRSFGFSVTEPENGSINIDYWDGDKMGWTWDEMWEMFSKSTSPETDIRWMIRGEDNEVWCEQICNNTHTTLRVEVIYQVQEQQ